MEMSPTGSTPGSVNRAEGNRLPATAESENPRLHTILESIGRAYRLQELLDAQICDIWIPVPKRTLLRILGIEDTSSFLDAQEALLDIDMPEDLNGRHLSLIDSHSLGFEEGELLGHGGFGEVYSVTDPRTGKSYARKVMHRPLNPKKHRDIMKIFKTELEAVRKVRRRHVVELMASCTDLDSVILLFSPVADMDLSIFLNIDLSERQVEFLRRSVGCITSALAYLHKVRLR